MIALPRQFVLAASEDVLPPEFHMAEVHEFPVSTPDEPNRLSILTIEAITFHCPWVSFGDDNPAVAVESAVCRESELVIALKGSCIGDMRPKLCERGLALGAAVAFK